MSVPVVEPLGPSTLAKKWRIDILTVPSPDGGTTPDVWTRLRGVTALTINDEVTSETTSDYDGDGWASSQNTSRSWGLEPTVRRATDPDDPAQYDAGQEFLRLNAATLGCDTSSVVVRYYEVNCETGPQVQAYQGSTSVAYKEQAGAPADLSTAVITLSGQGPRADITHPLAV